MANLYPYWWRCLCYREIEWASWMNATLRRIWDTFNSIIWHIMWTSNAWNHWCMRACMRVLWLAYCDDCDSEFCWNDCALNTHKHLTCNYLWLETYLILIMRYENDKTWHSHRECKLIRNAHKVNRERQILLWCSSFNSFNFFISMWYKQNDYTWVHPTGAFILLRYAINNVHILYSIA